MREALFPVIAEPLISIEIRRHWYLLNLYPNPFLIRWLNKNGITVNQDHFPLTMLLQWVFRSQIRDGKEINLYLPAFRMREILKRYLAD